MYNWTVDEKKLKKDKKAYAIWKLEQMVNFGLGKEKLNERLLKKYWKRIFMDEITKRYLKFILWPKKTKFYPKSKKGF